MSPQSVLDAASLIASAGAATAVVVQLVVMFLGVATARAKVGTAVLTAAVLTVAYAVSNGLLAPANVYGLIIAAVSIAAMGAGTQHAVTTTAAEAKS